MSRLAVALTLLLAAQAAAAQPVEDRTRIGIGAALLVSEQGYRSADTKTRLVPGLSVQNRWVNLFGPRLDLKLVGNESRSWWLGPRIEWRFDGYEADDGPFLAGMAERKGGLALGVAGGFEFNNRVRIDFDAVRATHSERGAVASLAISRGYRFGDAVISPRLGAEFANARHVDYYYGVRAVEARVDRPAYRGDSGWSPKLGVDARWRLDAQQSLFAALNVERHASRIANSPLVDRRGVTSLTLAYQFQLK